MFKDYEKYLSTSLKVYLFVLVIIFILKLVGLDYFGIDVNNKFLLTIDNAILKYNIATIYQMITLYINVYIYYAIVSNTKKVKIASIISCIVLVVLQFVLTHYKMQNYYVVFNFALLIIGPMIIQKKIFIKKQVKILGLLLIYQIISLCVRNSNMEMIYNSKLIDAIMNFDQIVMLLITYEVYFKEGGLLCLQEAFLSLLKKLNLKNLLKKLQKNLHNFKQLDKKTKLTYVIYFILSAIWNIFSVIVILIVARLNHTFIECIFILTSFWLSKHTFGKPFHLSSMAQCFVVSNLTYYFLNRITAPLGISILVPIMLGVGLSYVTSKLVKKLYKPLYKGMPEDIFEETILKVVDKDSDKYKICYDFFIKKKSAISLSMKYNYSEAGIRQITKRVNDKIKELK